MQDAWRLYVADGVRMISENTAKFAGGQYMKARWADILDPKPIEERTPEQVVGHVLGRLKEVSENGRT